MSGEDLRRLQIRDLRLGTMDQHRDWIAIDDIARLEGRPYQTVKKQLQRTRAVYMNDPEDGRRRLYAITAISPEARDKWLKEQSQLSADSNQASIEAYSAFQIPNSGFPGASQDSGLKIQSSPVAGAYGDTAKALNEARIQSLPSVTSNANPPQVLIDSKPQAQNSRVQPLLPFAPTSPSQDARDVAVAAVPRKFQKLVDERLGLVANNRNGTWKLYEGNEYGGFTIRKREDFLRAEAHLHGISMRTLYGILSDADAVFKDAQIPAKRKWQEITSRFVPKPRPGRSGHSFFVDDDNAWMWPELRRIWLDQSKPTKEQAHQQLLALIEKKQQVHGLNHIYQRPTFWQVSTALEKIPRPDAVLGREGEKAYYNQCAPSISRKPPEFSNMIWCTDQKVADVRVQDAGHRLGRLTSVSFIDVTSNRWLGCCFSPVLSSDTVMRAAVDAMIRTGTKPSLGVQHDLGKEFRCMRFGGGFFKISGEALFEEVVGMWRRLGVKPIPAIGNNPRTKPIERWHAELRKFDQQFSTWTGNNTDERPERLAKLEAQHAAWLRGEAENPHIPTIEEYIDRFLAWCAVTWNTETRGYGKYLMGMTPEECWNAKRPSEGFPTISEDEINQQSCERRKEQVGPGGQINLQIHGQKLEYQSDELFPFIGTSVEVLLSRITFRTVTVVYPIAGGTANCVAQVKQEYDWVPEGDDAQDRLRAQIRANNRLKRAVRTGLQATAIAADAANPAEVLTSLESLPGSNPLASRGLFGQTAKTEAPLGHPETGSVEYTATRRGRTASDIADRWEQEEK